MKQILQILFTFIGKALSENGHPSSMRLMTFIVLMLFSFALTFVLIYVTLKYPDQVTALAALYMATILGCLGMKKWQKDSEEKITNDQSSKEKK